jgi:deoxyribonuclease-4
MKKNILLGAHVSISGGLHLAFARAKEIGCTTMQIFTKNSRAWFDDKLTDEEISLFMQAAEETQIKPVVAHAGYLINIASSNPLTEKQSTASLIDEAHRCEALGIPYLVFHPGAHTGSGDEAGIKKIAKNLDSVLDRCGNKITILLETMSGQGTTLGSFEQLSAIRSLCANKNGIGVCLDTCHVFAAGHDITTDNGYERMWQNFDNAIGLKNLHVVHLNDSAVKLGSHTDRHAGIGKGLIPIKTFELFMNDNRLINIPKILETPAGWADEIALLRRMIK